MISFVSLICLCLHVHYIFVWTLIGASEQEFSGVTEARIDGGSVLSKTEAGEHGGGTH